MLGEYPCERHGGAQLEARRAHPTGKDEGPAKVGLRIAEFGAAKAQGEGGAQRQQCGDEILMMA